MVSPPQAGEGFLRDAGLSWENFTEEEGWGITMHWVKGYELPAMATNKKKKEKLFGLCTWIRETLSILLLS